tara:strand:+ start:501 stop:1418 length:918 start_codon:yes stop_codon:yes gene_type:complete
MKIKFSVIVNCKNSQEYLKDCLDSILNQSYEDFELIIIDNNSIDSTFKIINTFNDERIKYFNTKKNLSLGAARNLGIRHSSGSYIGFLDSDDLWHKNKLEETRKTIELYDSSIIYSNVSYFNKKESQKLYLMDKAFNSNIFEQQIENYNLCISSCIINKFYLLKLDFYFDEKLEVCEDYDLFLRLLMQQNASYIPEVLTRYRIHQNNLTKKKRFLFFEERNFVVGRLKKVYSLSDFLYNRMINQISFDKCIAFWKEKNNSKAISLLFHKVSFNFFKKGAYLFAFIFPYNTVVNIYKIFKKKNLDI